MAENKAVCSFHRSGNAFSRLPYCIVPDVGVDERLAGVQAGIDHNEVEVSVSKEAELAFLATVGEAGRQHSLMKPFSDPSASVLLASIGTIMSLIPPPPARILDLGCGGAWTSIFYAHHGYQVTGQDIAPDMIDLAIENRNRNGLSDNQLDFICGDFETIDKKEEYDCVIFFDSLHHADDEILAMRCAYSALKPGGMLLTHEPGEGHSTNPHSVAAMEQFGVNERDMPPSLIVRRGLEVGFKKYRVLPMPADLLQIFYERTYPEGWFSKRGFIVLRRIFRILFSPRMSISSIVVLKK